VIEIDISKKQQQRDRRVIQESKQHRTDSYQTRLTNYGFTQQVAEFIALRRKINDIRNLAEKAARAFGRKNSDRQRQIESFRP